MSQFKSFAFSYEQKLITENEFGFLVQHAIHLELFPHSHQLSGRITRAQCVDVAYCYTLYAAWSVRQKRLNQSILLGVGFMWAQGTIY